MFFDTSRYLLFKRLTIESTGQLVCLQAHLHGFEIARKDLEMRGPGEVLGTRQTGEQQFHIADLVRDQALLPKIDRAAALLLQCYPQNVDPLIRRWLGVREDYAGIGNTDSIHVKKS